MAALIYCINFASDRRKLLYCSVLVIRQENRRNRRFFVGSGFKTGEQEEQEVFVGSCYKTGEQECGFCFKDRRTGGTGVYGAVERG